ncbi:MAG: hypothetical protein JXB05_21075 [Myxococcaceae bacterium]|nr:hypothetical protein [Myxococcaceae bacterium]
MATTTFRDAMAGFSDVLYARAMEHMADRRGQLLGVSGKRANARANMSFDVTLGKGGMANVSVSRYCAGFMLNCAAWIESPTQPTRVSGFIHSSDGGGVELGKLAVGERVKFELKTSFWRPTALSVHLRTTPPLPEGTVLKVRMEIDY